MSLSRSRQYDTDGLQKNSAIEPEVPVQLRGHGIAAVWPRVRIAPFLAAPAVDLLQEMRQRLPDDAGFCLADTFDRVDDGEEQHQASGAVRAGLG